MRKITICIDVETEKQFQQILISRGMRQNWQKIPTYKEIMVDAIKLLYKEENDLWNRYEQS